jgi:hypothetical protein
MKFILPLMVSVALASTASVSQAQFVKGNEAVKVMPDGSRRVELPPTAGALLTKPCPAAQPGCSGGSWKMLETSDGLRECTEVYARPETDRKSVV